MLPQELCHAVIRRAAHSARVHETAACLHQLRHQERHPQVWYVLLPSDAGYFILTVVFGVVRIGSFCFQSSIPLLRSQAVVDAEMRPVSVTSVWSQCFNTGGWLPACGQRH